MTGKGNQWIEWFPAIVLSLAVNALMFGALPGLMQREAKISSERIPIHPVNFVRLKRETPPVSRKPPPLQKPKPARTEMKRPQIAQPQTRPELTIPFQPDRILPVTPGTISIPLARGIDLDQYPLKHKWGMGDLDQPLTPLIRIPPVYPLRAKRRGIEGRVKVKFLVRQNGTVAQVEILEAVPEKLFDNSVRSCISGWRFKPGTVDGEPVDVWAETVIRFKLE
jgi:protein TonB